MPATVPKNVGTNSKTGRYGLKQKLPVNIRKRF